VIVDIEDKTCPCCGGGLHVIGEDRAEMLDYIPARFQACPCEVAQRAGPHRFERKCSDCLIACGVGPDPDILSL
jgi:transposase